MVAAHATPAPRGPVPRAVAAPTATGRATARPMRSIATSGRMVSKPRVPWMTTVCTAATGRNRLMARSTDATSATVSPSARTSASAGAVRATSAAAATETAATGPSATRTVAGSRSGSSIALSRLMVRTSPVVHPSPVTVATRLNRAMATTTTAASSTPRPRLSTSSTAKLDAPYTTAPTRLVAPPRATAWSGGSPPALASSVDRAGPGLSGDGSVPFTGATGGRRRGASPRPSRRGGHPPVGR